MLILLDTQKLEVLVSQLKGKISDISVSFIDRQESALLYAWITKELILNPRLNRINWMEMLMDIINLHKD